VSAAAIKGLAADAGNDILPKTKRSCGVTGGGASIQESKVGGKGDNVRTGPKNPGIPLDPKIQRRVPTWVGGEGQKAGKVELRTGDRRRSNGGAWGCETKEKANPAWV